ncbi:MAG TPA: hypothetical protein VH143_24775 [Kofleriaceae bacterium]|nr:hypothetical protein [Kofleriaceae bacterium]
MRQLCVIALIAACNSHSSSSANGGSARATPLSQRDISLQRDANGAYWDATEHALYLTEGNALVRWTDAGNFTEVAQLGSAGVELGGLVRLPDGSFAITSFGFGSDGGVFVVDPSHQVRAVANLDPIRRRIGIARAPDGAIYDTYFVVNGHDHHGGVAALDLGSGGETEMVGSGLAKPVGIAALANELIVSDQDGNAIESIARGSNAAVAPIAANLPSVDLLTVLPDGSLVTGGRAGSITEVTRGGTQHPLAAGFDQVRGTAYDAAGKRLFVVEHGKAKHVLHILSLADST